MNTVPITNNVLRVVLPSLLDGLTVHVSESCPHFPQFATEISGKRTLLLKGLRYKGVKYSRIACHVRERKQPHTTLVPINTFIDSLPPARDSGHFRSLTLSADDNSVDVSGTFNLSLSGASNTVIVPFDANATQLEASGISALVILLF